MSAPAGRATVLGHAPFRRLWIGQAISETGDGFTALALLIVVHRLTGSAAAVGLVAVLTLLPQLALGLHAGVLVDRADRRRVMIASDLVRAAAVAALVLVRTRGDLWLLYALAMTHAAASVFFEPARVALLPEIVPSGLLLGANGVLQTTRVTGGVLGATLAGLLLARPNGARIAFTLDALSFAVSALAIASLPPARRAPGPDAAPSFHGELLRGLRHLAGDRTLRALLLTFAVTVLGVSAVNVLFVPFVLDDLHGTTATLGLLRAAQTVGMVGAGAAVAALSARAAPARLLAPAIAGLAAALAALSLARGTLAFLPALVCAGACSALIQAGSATLLQHRVPDGLRGRVESAFDTLLTLVVMAAAAAAGLGADHIGARRVLGLAALVTLGGALVAWRALRRPGTADDVVPARPGESH